MKDDFFSFVTVASFLKFPNKRTEIASILSKNVFIDQIMTEVKTGFGVVLAASAPVPLSVWLDEVSGATPISFSFGISASQFEGVPDRVLAAFQGGGTQLAMSLTASGKTRSFQAGLATNANHDMTRENFRDLIDAQTYAADMWVLIEKTIFRDLELSDVPTQTLKPIREHLNAIPDNDWNGRADDWIAEVQAEILTYQWSFIIPPKLSSLLEPFLNDPIHPGLSRSLKECRGPMPVPVNEADEDAWDQRRNQARAALQGGRWVLAPAKKRWQSFMLVEVPPVPVGAPTSVSLESAQENFIKCLRGINQGSFSSSFTRAEEILKSGSGLGVSFYESLGLGSAEAILLAAIDQIDIFGGMGSWNDQAGYDPAGDDLYASMVSGQVAALNSFAKAAAGAGV